VADGGGGERPADARERAGDHVLHVDRLARRGAHVLDADLVVLDGGREAPERRTEVAVHGERGERRDQRGRREHRVAHPRVGRAPAEDGRGQHVEAVGRAERLGLHQEPVEDHGEREAEQAEEDAAIAREQEPQHEGEQRGGAHAGEHQREDVAHAVEPAEHAGGVGADAVVERLAERDQAAAQEEDQPQRDQPLGDRHGEQEQRPARRDRPRQQDHPEQHRDGQQRAVAAHIFLASARLKRPRGRNASTIAITK